MSGTATALWKEGLCGRSWLQPLPSAGSECQCDGAGGWGLGSLLLPEMSRSVQIF